MPQTEALHYDPYQFAGHHAYAVSQQSRISFEDYSRMSTHKRKQVYERRLPTPMWALHDGWLRKLLLLFLESRAQVHNPKDDFLTRRDIADRRIKARIPEWNARIDRLQFEYVAAQKDGTPQERLRTLELEIENLDTLIRVTQKNTLSFVAAIVVLYYRLGKSSVEVGEEVQARPPHVRMILWRLHRLWNKHFNLDFMVEPAAPAVPACRAYTRQEIADALAAGTIQIPKDKARLQPPAETEWDIKKRTAPPVESTSAPRGVRKDRQPSPTRNRRKHPPYVTGESRIVRRARLMAAGICGNCEVEPRGAYSECPACRSRNNAYMRNYNKKKKAGTLPAPAPEQPELAFA